MEFVSGFETLDYRKSVFAISALCLISLIFMNGFQPKEREVVTIFSKKKQEVTIKRLVTSPTLFQSFEGFRKSADNVGEVLPPKFYDWQDLVFMFSLGILLGGPALFWVRSKNQKEEEEIRIRKEIALPAVFHRSDPRVFTETDPSGLSGPKGR